MLIIEPKQNELIVFKDKDSGHEITIRTFRRWCGTLNLGIDAPRAVKIDRIKIQRNPNGQGSHNAKQN